MLSFFILANENLRTLTRTLYESVRVKMNICSNKYFFKQIELTNFIQINMDYNVKGKIPFTGTSKIKKRQERSSKRFCL